MRKAAVLAVALACCLALLPVGASAEQTIDLESVFATLRFPDTWLVVTPASLSVYASILRDGGLDPDTMAERFAADHVVAEGWSETFDDSYRLIVREDERSQTLFDVARSSGTERKAIAASFTEAKDGQFGNLRYQEAEWSKIDSLGWVLYLRYNVNVGSDILSRGVQYLTIRNGKNYVLDWNLGNRRPTNRDLARFRTMLDGLAFAGGTEAPLPPARLEVQGGIPQELGQSELRLKGATEPEAGLVLTRDTGAAEPEVLSIGSANRQGDFTLVVTLPAQGTYSLTLTAVKEGYADTTVSGQLIYQMGLLPVNIAALPPTEYTHSTFELTGTAPAGTALQVVSGTKNIQRKVGNDGQFKIEIDTSAVGDYRIVLIATKKGYQERRITIEFTRVRSEGEELGDIKKEARTVTYAQLLRDPDAYVGALLAFTGEVVEISHGVETQVWFARLNVAKSKSSDWPMVLVCDADPQLQRGQKITFYGLANSPFIEQDASGNEISVPSLTLVMIQQ